MKKVFCYLLLITVCFGSFFCYACRFNQKTPVDYGESKWDNGENELIHISMKVDEKRTVSSTVTYNGIVKVYRNHFVSEMLYFIDDEKKANKTSDDEKASFSVLIISCSEKEQTCVCELDLKSFYMVFCGEDETTAQDGTYKFTLKKVE